MVVSELSYLALLVRWQIIFVGSYWVSSSSRFKFLVPKKMILRFLPATLLSLSQLYVISWNKSSAQHRCHDDCARLLQDSTRTRY